MQASLKLPIFCQVGCKTLTESQMKNHTPSGCVCVKVPNFWKVMKLRRSGKTWNFVGSHGKIDVLFYVSAKFTYIFSLWGKLLGNFCRSDHSVSIGVYPINRAYLKYVLYVILYGIFPDIISERQTHTHLMASFTGQPG